MANILSQDAASPSTELGRYRILSSTAGVRVSPLCLGSLSMGSAWSSSLASMGKEESFRLLDSFWDAGGNFVDTANNYQDEQSEQYIGEWMSTRSNRDMMFIATKFTAPYRHWELGPGKTINYSGNHKKSMFLSVEASLAKLQTRYIDLLIEELMDSLHILVEQGKVLYLGASDAPAWVVSAANTYARSHGKTPFSVYQGEWSLIRRDFEREIIPMARYYGMALCPWGVLGGGKFQTKEQLEQRRKDGENLRTLFGAGQSDSARKASEVLEHVAKRHGVQSIQQIALAYVTHKTRNVFPIVGGSKIKHLMENIEALKICLTRQEIKELEAHADFDIGFPMSYLGEDPHETGEMPPLLRPSGHIAW
ncbi:aryl-alcohol dehydrogenase AAD14 [Xylariaceae sp. FL1651]|nr:aryl-alcohol dehydrogenase AAD14 [Xylariaceae sp. FL1651]